MLTVVALILIFNLFHFHFSFALLKVYHCLFVVPRIPPTDFVLKPDSSGRGLIATWKAPDPIKVNGRIAFYIIKFRKVGSQVENTTAVIDVCKLSVTLICNLK